MKLNDLLYKVRIMNLLGSNTQEVNYLRFDSRKIKKGDAFIAMSGTQVDGHEFIDTAIEKGAAVIVCEILPEEKLEQITYVQVENAAIALGKMAANFFHNPTDNLKLIGVTGTNGKTTTATLLYELSEKMGYPAALISTINIKIHQTEIPSTHTTPDIVEINSILAEAVESGCEYAFMEVSSHGIHQHRIAGLNFAGGAFTNISHDHLDYHKTFKNYIEAKKKFFDDLNKKAFALINLDDKNGLVMAQNTKAKKVSFALKTDADYKGKVLENQFQGMLLNFNGTEFWTALVGTFNASNLLLVYGVSQELGWDKEEVLQTLSELTNVEGRFETFTSKEGIVTIVDYAHTPDALENVVSTIQNIRTKNEKLFVIVGCGGDRDKTKRPEMAKVATTQADQAILTSDNPRTEDPEAILKDMEEGIPPQYYNKYLKITDRKEAIKTAFKLASKEDIILIAGKGHENYQEINGIKYPFDDMEIAIEIANQLNK
ncbi:UDP-N-acetylmuramoyl-L-alanyl-D-glutamate--2,6-diaminopimelate ligase [Flavobacteriaceae bacterium Ap0902]|nr:UDP-N-acetylmuramoyl-L-alanyl-D-glutamate--2,6-diaminopimelate ligase [Flavobacteriaceae bacterium Ap0902]